MAYVTLNESVTMTVINAEGYMPKAGLEKAVAAACLCKCLSCVWWKQKWRREERRRRRRNHVEISEEA